MRNILVKLDDTLHARLKADTRSYSVVVTEALRTYFGDSLEDFTPRGLYSHAAAMEARNGRRALERREPGASSYIIYRESYYPAPAGDAPLVVELAREAMDGPYAPRHPQPK